LIDVALPRVVNSRWRYLGLLFLPGLYFAQSIAAAPHHLAYFNEVVGGPNNGYKYLIDSNVDWGQDLPTLKKWINLKQPDRLHLAFFGSAYPDRYGVNAIGISGYPNSAFDREADTFTSYSLEPGQYALSATLLRIGLVSRLFNAYQAFQSLVPIDQPASSILIYDVRYPAQAEVDRAVIVGPLAAEVPAAETQIDDQLKRLASSAGLSVTYPITVENGLVLAGYDINRAKDSQPSHGPMLNTYWRVTDRVQPPVTIFVHPLDQNGNIVAQDDSFGAAPRMLEPGDLIVQQHPLKSEQPLPPGTYQLAIGLYNPDTSSRFKSQTGEDRLLLRTVEAMSNK
jgi:hypothetical protein